MALNFIYQSNFSIHSHIQRLIASDTLSSILAIAEPPYNRNICPTIHNPLQCLLRSCDVRTSFIGSPNQKGIVGNERVDKAAKSGCSSPSADEQPLMSSNFFVGIAQKENEGRWRR